MMILAVMMVMTISANAMSYNAAKHEALFLSDKMAPVKVDKRHGISNHTLASNTPRHGHSNAGHFGGRR